MGHVLHQAAPALSLQQVLGIMSSSGTCGRGRSSAPLGYRPRGGWCRTQACPDGAALGSRWTSEFWGMILVVRLCFGQCSSARLAQSPAHFPLSRVQRLAPDVRFGNCAQLIAPFCPLKPTESCKPLPPLELCEQPYQIGRCQGFGAFYSLAAGWRGQEDRLARELSSGSTLERLTTVSAQPR